MTFSSAQLIRSVQSSIIYSIIVYAIYHLQSPQIPHKHSQPSFPTFNATVKHPMVSQLL